MALAISLADAQTQLATVQAALQDIITGKRINHLVVGSGQFKREMQYQEITVENLRQMQAELLTDLDYYTNLANGNSLPNFAPNRTIPMLTRKDYFNVWAGRVY